MRAPAGRRGRVAAPALLVGVVLICDRLLPVVRPNLVLIAALDEPAHLATAALVLMTALDPARSPQHLRWVPTTLAAAVLIDLDHIPQYLGAREFAPAGRPLTHSLLTPLVLITLAALLRGRARRAVAAVALGTCLHFVRDLATGPGISLVWPISWRAVLLPYWSYAITIAVLGGISAARRMPRRRPLRG